MLVFVALMVPSVMRASGSAVFQFDQSAYNVVSGEFFEVTVHVDPQGELLDTVRAVVTFDPTVMQAQNVRLSGSFDRTAPGNYRDNVNGKISWGAFTLGEAVSTEESVMVITFLALEAGEGRVAISGDSHAISAGEERIDVSVLAEASVFVSVSEEADLGTAVLVVESSTHPDQQAWSSLDVALFSWKDLEGESPIREYFYRFDNNPTAEADISLPAETTDLSVIAEQDGIYYFHLKGLQEDGRETEQVNYVVQIDRTSPNPITLTAQQTKLLEGESAWFVFGTTDELSGVAEYQVAINDSEFQTQISPLEIEDLPVGTYFFRVAALDRAGNTVYGSTSVRVYPEGTDLNRPEGLEEDGEVGAIRERAQEEIDMDGNFLWESIPVIPVLLGLVVLFAIIYYVQARKK